MPMTEQKYNVNYCPNCGHKEICENKKKVCIVCNNCGFSFRVFKVNSANKSLDTAPYL